MKKIFGFTLFVILIFFSQKAYASDVSANIISHDASPFFVEGRKLYKAGEYKKAMVTLKKAVEDGDAWAAALIGSIYEIGGDEITPNLDNAKKWYSKATEMGYPASDAFWATLYLLGEGGFTKNINKAYELIHNIENLELEDDDYVQNMAYQFYLNGWGTPKNLEKAKQIASKIKYEESRNFALKRISEAEEALKGLSAKFLISEIEKNRMRFDKNYKNKKIIVKGFVGDITEKKNIYSLSLFGETGIVNPFKFIECRFEVSEEDSLLELNKGENVIIEGTYKGKEDFQIGSMVFHNCQILKNE